MDKLVPHIYHLESMCDGKFVLFSHAYVSYLDVRFCTGAASRKPSSVGSAERARSSSGVDGGGESPATTIVTPKARIKRSDTDESVPKLSRAVQSRELLKRSPTVHYSPGKTRPKKVKKTAVKAKAKAAVSKSAPSAATPKQEPPTPATATAVASALTRKTTDELSKVATPASTRAPPSPEPPSPPSASSDEGSGEEDPEPPGDECEAERSLEEVRARKAAHARYMRFSRSLKSNGFLLYVVGYFRRINISNGNL